MSDSNPDEATKASFYVTITLVIILLVFLTGALYVINFVILDENGFSKNVDGINSQLNSKIVQLFTGNIKLTELRKTKNNVTIQENTFLVSDGESARKYYFVEDTTKNLAKGVIAAGEQRTYTKQGNNFAITTSPQTFNKHLHACEKVERDHLFAITLDPGHGGSDAGHVAEGTNESTLSRELAQQLKGFDSTLFSSSTVPLRSNTALKASERRIGGDAVLSLHYEQQTEQDNNIKAYISDNNQTVWQSRLLACQLSNKLSNYYLQKGIEVSGVTIIPVNKNTIDNEDPRQVLMHNTPGVQLIIGNIHNENIRQDTQRIAEELYKGLEEYGVIHVRT